jgi:AcrR family transcriptional regulator
MEHQGTRGDALEAMAGEFAQRGFHGVTPGHLQAASGMAAEEIQRLYGDKEAVFYACLQYCQANLAREQDAERIERFSALLQRLQATDGNMRLRTIHGGARRRLRALLDEWNSANSSPV